MISILTSVDSDEPVQPSFKLREISIFSSNFNHICSMVFFLTSVNVQAYRKI